MFTFLIFLFILGTLIIVHEFGHFIAARRLGVKVEKFSFGFGKRILSKKKNDTEYSINLIPLGGYVKLAGDNLEEYSGNADEYMAKTPFKRAQIIFFGPLLNYVLGLLCFWMIFFIGYPTLTTKVGGVIDGFGAKEAGIQADDRIIGVDGKRVELWEELQSIIQDKKTSAKVTLSVLRNNKEYIIEVKLKERQLDDILGQKRSVALIGILPKDETVNIRHGLLESLVLSSRKTLDLTTLTYKAMWRMIAGKLSMRESMTGPLGIFHITSKVAGLGAIAVLHLIAVLSVSLSIFNLLPLPVLDGGHIVLLAIEKIRGRHLSPKIERIITHVGLTFIITLAIIATYNDLTRLFGDRFPRFLK